MSREFNTKQICLVENVIREICRNDVSRIADFEEQLNRYSCFMCFAILAAAAEGGHFKSIPGIRQNILNSLHKEKIARAEFANITAKSRVAIFLMKKQWYITAFCFLYLCKIMKTVLKRR